MPFTSIRRLAGMIAVAVLTFAVAVAIHPGASHAYAAAPDAPTPADTATAGNATPDTGSAGPTTGTPVGAVMDPAKNIAENLSKSRDHTTFVAALKATGLDETLTGPGPVIVFAPNNAAFAKLPKDQLDELMKPENSAKLTAVLNYHIVPGRMTMHDLNEIGRAGNKIPMKTLQGDAFNITKIGEDTFSISDESGNKGRITQGDLKQSNGAVFVIDTVLMPKQ